MSQKLPQGWDEGKVQGLIDYFDNQSEEEAVAIYKEFTEKSDSTLMSIPVPLVPAIESILTEYQKGLTQAKIDINSVKS